MAEVLDMVDELAESAADADAVRLAAWFHDAVYEIGAGTAAGAAAGAAAVPVSNEEASARLAESVLTGLGIGGARVSEVLRLVRLTERHSVEAGDRNGAVLSDADLAILGAGAQRYEQYAQEVREEFRAVADDLFRAGRVAILKGLLDQPALFRTPAARARYDERARENMRAEIARLYA